MIPSLFSIELDDAEVLVHHQRPTTKKLVEEMRRRSALHELDEDWELIDVDTLSTIIADKLLQGMQKSLTPSEQDNSAIAP